jgi:hypothetical protein
MLDRERILARVDVLDGCLRELRTIAPTTFEDYLLDKKPLLAEKLFPRQREGDSP